MADVKHEDVEESPDIHFEPVIKLPEIEVKSLEEEEEEVLKIRAKLFRFDSSYDPPEWKERGTGECKLLKHKESGLIRVLMRRDKTLKVCANHYITAQMELKPNCGSDRAWLWSVAADYADEEAKPETLAIRFANADNAKLFKEKFDDAKKANQEMLDKEKSSKLQNGGDGDKPDIEADSVTEKLGEMSVKSDSSKNDSENKTDDEKKGKNEEQSDSSDKKEEPPVKTDS